MPAWTSPRPPSNSTSKTTSKILPNTAKGHARLIQLLRAVPGSHLICEATGGYERAVVAALHAAQLPVSVVNPAQVRHFALAQGARQK